MTFIHVLFNYTLLIITKIVIERVVIACERMLGECVLEKYPLRAGPTSSPLHPRK